MDSEDVVTYGRREDCSQGSHFRRPHLYGVNVHVEESADGRRSHAVFLSRRLERGALSIKPISQEEQQTDERTLPPSRVLSMRERIHCDAGRAWRTRRLTPSRPRVGKGSYILVLAGSNALPHGIWCMYGQQLLAEYQSTRYGYQSCL